MLEEMNVFLQCYLTDLLCLADYFGKSCLSISAIYLLICSVVSTFNNSLKIFYLLLLFLLQLDSLLPWGNGNFAGV